MIEKYIYEYSAGAILYTRIEEELYFVLVQELDGHIGFPKGHLEKGETEIGAAKREIKEETDIDATFVEGFMEDVEYEKEMHIMKHVTYFLATYDNQEVSGKENEIMKLFLLPYKQALSKVTYNNSKELLQKAMDYIGKNNTK
ncbi:bis(5'-nucleosyl)-tetraphosphatase [Anaerorhabdus furcosa]|uniref:Bis(5'-nucleosyl)-tetraphosphatase [asymmetrical] n=1 Tax=Anaerorhabdus furcosa TaxID=118967 RepID=A0A1T4JUF2_9FIRM|nr:NUDIX domain-containing protein [Anaerorhabdus furcosa]SJZ33773.1 NUDIX domain-containing protein [Anaerorhabdus furcosa]